MKEQFDDKAKDTTTIKSTPVEQTKASKDELSEQEPSARLKCPH